MPEQFLTLLAHQLGVFLIRLGLAVAVVWLGLWLMRYSEGALRQMVYRARPDAPAVLEKLATHAVQVAGVIVIAILVLALLGFNISALVASLGLVSVALGFALKDTIEQAVTGTLLLLIRPFDIGDAIEVDGIEGVVTDVGLRTTELRTGDGIHVLIPNNKVYQSVLRNKTHYPTRRFELILGLEYNSDIRLAHQVFAQAIAAVPEVLAEPAPAATFDSFGESTLRLVVRYWLPTTADSGAVHTAVAAALLEAAQHAHIPITERMRIVMMNRPDVSLAQAA